jgi:hypothetical protein
MQHMLDAVLPSVVCDERHNDAAINAITEIETKHFTQCPCTQTYV